MESSLANVFVSPQPPEEPPENVLTVSPPPEPTLGKRACCSLSNGEFAGGPPPLGVFVPKEGVIRSQLHKRSHMRAGGAAVAEESEGTVI